MESGLEGKIALVTGAGNRTGIGCGIARRLCEYGARVVITDLATEGEVTEGIQRGSLAALEATAVELGEQSGAEVLALPMDVSDADSIQSVISGMSERFGRIDVLFNNAGTVFGAPSPLHEYDIKSWERTLDVNLTGVLRVSQAAVPLMRGAPSAIVNTSSRAGKMPAATNGAYSVSKAGVIMATKVMAVELAEHGIRVNAVCPGLIDTDLQRGNVALKAHLWGVDTEQARGRLLESVPLKRMGTVDEVADLCVYLGSGRSSYVTGQAVNIGGGILVEV